MPGKKNTKMKKKYIASTAALGLLLVAALTTPLFLSASAGRGNELEHTYWIELDCRENEKKTSPEQSVKYDIIVKNSGNTEDEIELIIGGPAYMLDSVGSWLVLPNGSDRPENGKNPTLRLEPNESAFIGLFVHIYYSHGTFEINVTGRSRGFLESDPRNVSQAVEDTIETITTVGEPRYGIDLQCRDNEKVTFPEKTAYHYIDVVNTGTVTDEYEFQLGGPAYMLDGVGSWLVFPDGSTEPANGYRHTLHLRPGETMALTLNVNVYYSKGTYEINVTGRSLGSSEVGTIRTFTTIHDGTDDNIDLIPKWIIMGCNCTPVSGENTLLRAFIRNTGNGTASRVLAAFFDNNRSIGNATVDEIAGGKGVDVWMQWIPETPGNHTVLVVVDPVDSTKETDEYNNYVLGEIRVMKRADNLNNNAGPKNNDPKNGDNVTIGVRAHKAVYAPGENIDISIVARNPDPHDVKLELRGNSTYAINIYDDHDERWYGRNHWEVFGSIIIPANTEKVIIHETIGNNSLEIGDYRVHAEVFASNMKLEGEIWISVAKSQANGINTSDDERVKSEDPIPTEMENEHAGVVGGNEERRSANIIPENFGSILHILGFMGMIGMVIVSLIIYLKARND